jgi:hypothetical protein
MSLDIAAEYAPVLTSRGPATAAPHSRKLSATEWELVTLVAQGHTHAQIAAQIPPGPDPGQERLPSPADPTRLAVLP